MEVRGAPHREPPQVADQDSLVLLTLANIDTAEHVDALVTVDAAFHQIFPFPTRLQGWPDQGAAEFDIQITNGWARHAGLPQRRGGSPAGVSI